jgi:hypothetical protein
VKVARKIFLCGVVVSLAAPAIYQQSVFRERSAAVVQLERDLAIRRQRLAQLPAENPAPSDAPPAAAASSVRDAATTDDLTSTGDPHFDSRLRAAMTRVQKLKACLASDPRQQIPEFRFLDDAAWFEVADVGENSVRLDSDLELQFALSHLRREATDQFLFILASALGAYLKASGDRLPTDLSELKPYGVTEIDDALLTRYELRASGSVAGLPPDFPLVGRKANAPTAELERFGFNPIIPASFLQGRKVDLMPKFLGQVVTDNIPEAVAIGKATQAFMLAHDFREPRDAAELAPYFEHKADAKRFLQSVTNPEEQSAANARAGER